MRKKKNTKFFPNKMQELVHFSLYLYPAVIKYVKAPSFGRRKSFCFMTMTDVTLRFATTFVRRN